MALHTYTHAHIHCSYICIYQYIWMYIYIYLYIYIWIHILIIPSLLTRIPEIIHTQHRRSPSVVLWCLIRYLNSSIRGSNQCGNEFIIRQKMFARVYTSFCNAKIPNIPSNWSKSLYKHTDIRSYCSIATERGIRVYHQRQGSTRRKHGKTHTHTISPLLLSLSLYVYIADAQ